MMNVPVGAILGVSAFGAMLGIGGVALRMLTLLHVKRTETAYQHPSRATRRARHRVTVALTMVSFVLAFVLAVAIAWMIHSL